MYVDASTINKWYADKLTFLFKLNNEMSSIALNCNHIKCTNYHYFVYIWKEKKNWKYIFIFANFFIHFHDSKLTI